MLVISCQQTDTPRPRGYFRIALPEKAYVDFDTLYPYSFQYPVYSVFSPDERETAEAFWADILFPDFDGVIHLSYKTIGSREDLEKYLEDARTFVHRHIPKATAIYEETIVHSENNVYGMIFRIMGREAASALQFYATDSTDHFLRGALYFHVPPNNDSLAPVIGFLERDIRHLLSTLEWDASAI